MNQDDIDSLERIGRSLHPYLMPPKDTSAKSHQMFANPHSVARIIIILCIRGCIRGHNVHDGADGQTVLVAAMGAQPHHGNDGDH